MKGLVFAGCSYTWGQGLYFYSDLNHLPKFEDWVYDYSLMTDALIKYKDTIRYPRLVANHFKTFEVCKVTNGGSDLTSINFLKKIFDKYGSPVDDDGHLRSCVWLSTENYHFDDIEYVIFQTTQPYRSKFKIKYKNKNYFVYPNSDLNKVSVVMGLNDIGEEYVMEDGIDTIFYNWLMENNYQVEDFLKMHLEYWTNEIKTYLIFLEKKGIKTKILNWTNDYSDIMSKDDFCSKRIINLEYGNKTYKTISDLQNSDLQKFTIANDTHGFNGVKPEEAKTDYHPSKYCHEILSKNIIKSIESQ
jgi:hypothetical protein